MLQAIANTKCWIEKNVFDENLIQFNIIYKLWYFRESEDIELMEIHLF